MYRTKGSNIVLQDILAKVRDPNYIPAHSPIVYADSDIVKAKTVLDRLLAMAATSEISSIKEAAVENSEVRN